ncbi:MAG: AEC family transporter [Yoonia sp.]|nr:AEC family transporter [Yoonia sp.]
MGALINVILPVFLVIGFGYLAVWKGYFNDAGVDGLMKFTQSFAIPCLLFRAISTLDLGQSFQFELLLSYYTGALAGFIIGFLGARYIFGRRAEDSVAIGFIGLFSNSLLLGLPITEQAYGIDALTSNYAIIAVHSPFCYAVGITAMEIVRNAGHSITALPAKVLRAMFKNALILGISLGFAVNLSGITLPEAFTDAVDLMVRAALPAALFGLGGVLYRYQPEGDMRTIFFIVTVSLVVHPVITFSLGTALGLSVGDMRSSVMTGAMAPGINAYVFANMYGAARRVAASAVLIGTAMSVVSVWIWLSVLP